MIIKFVIIISSGLKNISNAFVKVKLKPINIKVNIWCFQILILKALEHNKDETIVDKHPYFIDSSLLF